MIVDTIENAARYASAHRLLPDAFAALRDPDVTTLPPGEYEVQGRSLYVVVTEGKGKAPSEAPLEAHRRYIDIHYLLSGEESIGWKGAGDCVDVRVPYEEGKDIAFWEDTPTTWIRMRPGMFAVFFPPDAHAPMVSTGSLRKIIVKVALESIERA